MASGNWELPGNTLLVVSQPRNPSREPDATGVANQEHGAWAVRWDRIQRIVDLKIAVRSERNAYGGVVLDERSGGLADQCGEHALIGVLADAVAAGEEQAAPPDRDAAVDVDGGSEIGDSPRS